MSSITRALFRLRSGRKSVILDKILGQGGRALMIQAMETITKGSPALTMADQAASQLAWRVVEQDSRQTTSYRLTLSGANLSEVLRSASVEQLQIDLNIGPSLASVSNQITMRGGSGLAAASIREEAESMANESVNRVIAIAVAQRLAERVQEYASQRIEQQVQIRVSQSFDIRTYAFVN